LPENKTNVSEISREDPYRPFIEVVKMVQEDIKNGNEPLIVFNIPKRVSEEFEKKIMANPKHQGETVGRARNKEILNFMLRTIKRTEKKA
jgi:hypothetical protein